MSYDPIKWSSDEYLDSRDLNEYLSEMADRFEDPDDYGTMDERNAWSEVRKLEDQCEGMGWEDGMRLIPCHLFEDYARELADDIGAMPDAYTWPISCIDWEHAARELSWDYVMVTFRGVDYYTREA